MSSANVTVESPSAQQNSDSASSSYANVVLNLKTPREDKNDNNKENIEKDVNLNKHSTNAPVINDVSPPPDKRNPTDDTTSTTTIVNNTSTTQTDQQELVENDDDESFIPVVSHSRKERKIIRKEKPSRDRAVKQQRRLDSTETREKRDSKRSKDRPEAAAKELAKIDTSLDSTSSPKTGNEDEAENVPVKFVEAPIPATNAWKVNILSFRIGYSDNTI